MKQFDPTKLCQYRNGEPARILCTNAAGFQEIRAQNLITNSVTSHTLDGFYLHTKDEYLYDLINIPAKKTVELWVNVYQVGFDTYECEEYAKNDTRRGLFARKKITFEVEEGEGL